MKPFWTTVCSVVLAASVLAQDSAVSLKAEAAQAIRRATAYLASQQDAASGAIGDKENPAITALAVMALMGDPGRGREEVPAAAAAGYKFLAANAKPDGSVFVKSLMTYNTSLSLTAFMLHPQGGYRVQAEAARKFLISQQHDLGEKGQTDDPRDGGIGYGGSSPTSDMSNTHFALEALYFAKALDAEKPGDQKPKLNYAAALQFISNCQNLKKHNAAAWVSEDEANKGGFIYEPGVSKAPEMKLPDGKTALRSYGSISYAGLLSLVYAELKPTDDRIQAVLAWLQANYTLEENPGMEQQGLYYYYHTMAKALGLLRLKELTLKDGTKVDWRQQLATKLLNTQQPAGTWTNPTARWRESDAVYATSLATLALIHLHNAL